MSIVTLSEYSMMSSRRPLSLALSLINKDFITVSSFCSVGAQCALHYGGMLMDLQELLGREVPDDAPANCRLRLSPRPRPRPLRGGERGEMGGENCGGLYLVSSRRASALPALVGEGFLPCKRPSAERGVGSVIPSLPHIR